MTGAGFGLGFALGSAAAFATDILVILWVRPRVIARRTRLSEEAFAAGREHVRLRMATATRLPIEGHAAGMRAVLLRRCTGAKGPLSRFEEGMRWQLRLYREDGSMLRGNDRAS